MAEERDRGSVLATDEGIQILRDAKAAKRNHEGKLWTYPIIASKAGASSKTVERFFRQEKPIDESYARAICQALEVDFSKVVDLRISENPPYKPKHESKWQHICRAMLDLQKKLSTNEVIASETMRFDLLNDEIFVSLALVERKEPDRLDQAIHPSNSVDRYEEKPPIEYETFREQVLRRGKSDRIAIVGEPGAGKTTLLQHIAFWILDQELGLPIWISLGDLIKNGDLQLLKDYLTQVWLENAIPNVTQDVKSDFLEQLNKQKVWLLLDGADEIVASSGITLHEISRQLGSWLSLSSILLTCRINIWDAGINALTDFQTYRTKEFHYPTQVEQFIEKGFCKSDRQSGESLKTELAHVEHVRLQQLVRNPLRLMMLCTTWHEQKSLPATKAELYERFVGEFYRWNQTKWQKKDLNYAFFPNTKAKQEKLNKALGHLACRALDEEPSPFRLPHNLVLSELGDPNEEGSDFWLALNLGWLQVARDSDNLSEKVYTFFHPTFQEYFAALAIADWHEFLNHIPDNPHHPEAKYRVFEPHWQEVILLWIGRPNTEILQDQKNAFIKALIDFEDNCQELYGYRAYFSAGEYIAEFANCDYADEIIKKIVEWAFGFFDLEKRQWMTHYLFSDLALSIIKKTNKIKAKPELIYLFNYLQNEEIKIAISQSNGEGYYEELAIQILLTVLEISPEDLEAIIHITKLVNVSDSFICQEFKGVETSQLIERIKTSPFFNRRKVQNNTADLDENRLASSQEILNLVTSLADIQDGDPRHGEVLSILNKITFRNPNAITAFIEIIEASLNPEIIVDNYVVFVTVQHINRIGITSPQMADILMQLLLSNIDFGNYMTRYWALCTLISVSASNQDVFDFLTELVHERQDWAIRINSYRTAGVSRCVAANGLGMIANKDLFPLVVSNLKEYLQDESYNSNRMLQADCYSTLFHCAQSMSYPDFYQAWHHPNSS